MLKLLLVSVTDQRQHGALLPIDVEGGLVEAPAI